MKSLRELLGLPELSGGVEADGGALREALAALAGAQESHAALSDKLAEHLEEIPDAIATSLSTIDESLAQAAQSKSPDEITAVIEMAQDAMTAILTRAMKMAPKSLQDARRQCDSLINVLKEMRKDAEARLNDPLPAALDTGFSQAEAALVSGKAESDVVSVETAIEAGEKEIERLIDEIAVLVAARVGVADTLKELVTLVGLLNDHTGKAHLGPELARLQGEVAKAQGHNAAHSYADVATICSLEVAKARAATKKADAAERYELVKPARAKRLAEFDAVTNDFVKAERDQIKVIFDAATVAGDAGKFGEALEKLDKLPKMLDALEVVDSAQKEFEMTHSDWKTGHGDFPIFFHRPESVTEFASEIASFKAMLDDSRADAAAGRFVDAITKLSKLWALMKGPATQARDHHGPYVDWLAVVEPDVAALRTQSADFDFAEISAAVDALDSQMRDVGNMATDRRFDAAVDLLSAVDKRRAELFEIADQSGKAKKRAKQCREKLAPLRALGMMGHDLDAADMLLRGADFDITNHQWAEANDGINDANKIVDNVLAAKAALEVAATTAEEIAQKKAAENAVHDDTFHLMKSLIEFRRGEANGLNQDNVLDTDIAAIDQKLADAIARAAITPDPDYAGALRLLQEAEEIGAKAEDKIKAHIEHEALKNNKATLTGEDTYVGCTGEIDDWDSTRTTAWGHFAAGDFVKCRAELKKVARGYDRVKKTVKAYTANRVYLDSDVLPWTSSPLPNPIWDFDAETVAAHKSLTDEANRLLAKGALEVEAKNGALGRKLLVTSGQQYGLVTADVARRRNFKDTRPDAVTGLADLKVKENDGVKEDLTRLNEVLKEADALDEKRHYAQALEKVQAITSECATLITYADNWADWKTAQDAAVVQKATLVALVKAGEGSPTLLGTLTAAATEAEDRLARSAELVKSDAVAALGIANQVAAVVTAVMAQARTHQDGLPGADAAALRAAFQALEGHDLAVLATARLVGIDERITEIEAAGDGADASTLKAVAGDIMDARVVLAAHAGAQATHKRLSDKLDDARGLLTDAKPLVLVNRIDAIGKAIGLALAASGIESFDQAAKMHGTEAQAIKQLEDEIRAHDQYRSEIKEVEDGLAALAKHKGKFAVGDEVVEIGKLLRLARSATEIPDFHEALRLVSKASGLYLTAWMVAKMNANQPPTKDDIKALLDMKDGGKNLDRIVRDLDDRMQAEVMEMVFEIRFDVDLKNYTTGAYDVSSKTVTTAPEIISDADDLKKRAPNIKRLYELCAEAPDNLTTGNPFLHEIQRYHEDEADSPANARGSYYDEAERLMVLSCGRANQRDTAKLADPAQLPDIDPECRPVGDTKTNYFNWTSQHEVGHAVDDQNRYMVTKGKNSDHGNWKDHGADISEVADVIADAYAYDPGYVRELMSGDASPSVPEPKDGVNPDAWEDARRKVHEWYSAARESSAMWNNGSACSRFSFGTSKRVYHEAYENDWVSYDLAARKQGVSGYQFRAPAEWFSELYAAYTTKKMNPDHPANTWLKKLLSPQEGA